MSAVIRQEINILNETISSTTGGNSSSEKIQYDASQYNGTVNVYFEILAKNTDSTNKTVQATGTNNTSGQGLLTVTAGTSAFTLFRSSAAISSFTDATNIFLDLASTTSAGQLQVKSARLVIIQSATTLTNTETQIEIGNAESQTINNVDTALTKPKYWKYTAANWDGTKTFYCEVVGKRDSSTMSSSTWILQEADGTGDGFVNWSNKVTVISATTSTSVQRTRVSFTPTDGRNYRITSKDSDTMNGGHTTYNAKIIVDQADGVNAKSGGSSLAIQGGTGGTGSNQAIAQSFKIATTSTITTVKLRLAKTGTPSDTLNIDIVSSLGGSSLANGTIAASSLTTSLAEYTITFGTPVSLTGSTTYYIQLSRTPDTNNTSNFFNVEDGGANSYSDGSRFIRALGTWDGGGGDDLYFVLAGQSGFTKLEGQYLPANTGLAAGTGFQTFLTTFDPTSTEWDDGSGTTTYSAAVDAANGSTSVVTIQKSDGSATYATVTSPDNQGISTFSSVPGSSTTLDVKATTNNGDVYGVRILVAYVFSAAAPAPFIAALPYLVTRQANFRSNYY